MIKKLTKLAKEEGIVLDYYIGPDNTMTITVFAKHRDHIIIDSLSFNDDEIIEITKDVIRKAKDDQKIVALFMRFFVKMYFKLDKECYCYCIGTKGDNDDFDIHRREYKNE